MCTSETAPNENFEMQKKTCFETVCSQSDLALSNPHIAFLYKPTRGELHTHVEQNHVVLLAMREH